VQGQVAVRREQDKLPPWVRDQMRVGLQDGVPKGYEEMVAEYYRALAEGTPK
jgi:aldehyde:ferredoxin oxidoreductase